MIDIQINPRQFEYDIQSLVQAFYIGHSFKINGQVEVSYMKDLKQIYLQLHLQS